TLDAMDTLFMGGDRNIRVIGTTPYSPGDFVEAVLHEGPLRSAMIAFALNILQLSIVISLLTASLVFLALNWVFVRPMHRLTVNMVRFRDDPESLDRIIEPSNRRDEIGVAQRELARMQGDLSQMLKQKSRLAALGLAVSKISHDLRNMLSSAHLMSDRLTIVEDPTVKRFAPKLIASLDRAVDFCTQTLKFGKVQELPPRRTRFLLSSLIVEVEETAIAEPGGNVRFFAEIQSDLEVDADRDQLFRVLVNLVRNADQALQTVSTERPGEIKLFAWREGSVVTVEVSDNGPGVPERAREHLFDAFQGSVRSGGTGLGLAIAGELIRAHGGTIVLADVPAGATFRITLPDRVTELPFERRETRKVG
ncbi:MAG: HAMP domain-containing histidine kinase, partial [Gammaproteobacteria bacterium]|nr:HAMP domain-containing histidine kinase [Gammaproteobacteria bacterium]